MKVSYTMTNKSRKRLPSTNASLILAMMVVPFLAGQLAQAQTQTQTQGQGIRDILDPLDCEDIKKTSFNITTILDVYDLDRDNDGIACELGTIEVIPNNNATLTK